MEMLRWQRALRKEIVVSMNELTKARVDLMDEGS